MASKISQALKPCFGSWVSGMPQKSAMNRRCSGLLMSRPPGSWLQRYLRCLHDAARGHAGDGFGDRGRVFPHQLANLVEVVRVVGDEFFVNPTALDQHMQNAVREGAVAARANRQEEVCRARDGRDARVDDDDFRAVVAGAPDVVGEDRETFGDVAAGDQQRPGKRDITPRVGGAVQAEGHPVRRSGADHAEAAIVINVRRAEGDARKLAVEICLFVRHRCATEELHALRTKLALVDREFFPRFESDHFVIFDLELNAALHAAEATMRLHEPVRFTIVPPARGRVGGRGAEQLSVALFG